MRQHMMTASVLAVVGLGTTFPTTSAAAASNPDSINRAAVSQSAGGNLVVDVPAALIRYQGTYYTDNQIAKLTAHQWAKFGDVRVENGILVAAAFDTLSELWAYEASKGDTPADVPYPPDETPQQRAARLTASGEDVGLVASVTGIGGTTSLEAYAMIPGCPALTYGSRDYDDANCGGAYLASFPTDAIARYGDYGHGDKMTSLDIENNGGGCIVVRTLYNNTNYNTTGGVWRYSGTAYEGTSVNLPSSQNDRVSSSKSQCS